MTQTAHSPSSTVTSTETNPPGARWRPYVAVVIDLALVTGFAALGMRSHEQDVTGAELFRVATPFALACLFASVMTGFWRSWQRLWPAGIVVWLSTVFIGVALRVLIFTDGSHWSFVTVSLIVVGMLLLGRRGISQLISFALTNSRRSSPTAG
ncbi:DUF3054 domain-containing protein [Auritidibacter ignavus]|uniref:DUF3054 domain-containing protein n=1 Tax=Auritidibacter ignavus TaxID=678932 RepID=UPI002FE5C3C9